MDPFVPLMAAAYLILQIPALFWTAPVWRKFGRFPIWTCGAATVLLVVGNAMGSTLAVILLIASLPLMTFYLVVVWALYLLAGQRRMSAAA